jgi:hypothetical protein
MMLMTCGVGLPSSAMLTSGALCSTFALTSSSFGLNTASDFLQKLREERADFVHSKCLDPRHAVNAVMNGYHMYEWVFPEISGRPHKKPKDFRDALIAMPGSPIEDARRVTNGTKHFQQAKIKTGSAEGAFQRSMVQPNAFDVDHLWIERGDGRKQRAEDFIDEIVEFWDGFFADYGLPRYADAVGRSGRERCQCGDELIDIDTRGEHLTGCLHCNRWEPIAKRSIRLSTEDLHALRLLHAGDK